MQAPTPGGADGAAAQISYNPLHAILAAVAVTLLVTAIELPSHVKARLRACLNWSSFTYFLILALGNVAGTFLAGSLVGTKLPQWPLFWHVFFGVFGFHIVLKNTNVTVFDKGVLTIEAWISKALANAIEASQSRDADWTIATAVEAAERLREVPEAKLNAYIEQYLGPGKAAELQQAAAASGSEPTHYKAFALAQVNPRAAAAVLKSLKKKK
jgi:hypothetical protein